MKARGLTVLSALAWLCGFGDAPPAGPDDATGPRIAFEKQEYDFGSIKQNEERKASLPVRNAGDAPLKIQRIMSSCGCAVADPWAGVIIPPGGEKTLDIKLNGKMYFGKLRKHIKIRSSDLSNPVATIGILLEVKADYWLERRSIKVDNMRRSMVSRTSIPVKSFMDQPLEFKELSSSEAFLQASLEAHPPEDGHSGFMPYTLDIAVDGAKIPLDANRVHALIRFKPNTPTIREDTVVVNITVIEDIAALPDRIVFDQCPSGKAQERTLLLKHAKEKVFHVLEIRSSSPFVSARVEREGQGEAEINVRLSEKALPGILRAELRIRFDIGNDSVMTIPVRGFIKRGD
jgi:hypothetical protein